MRPAERVFSVAGQVVDKRRCKLGNSMIDALIFFLHCNGHMLGLTQKQADRGVPGFLFMPPADTE